MHSVSVWHSTFTQGRDTYLPVRYFRQPVGHNAPGRTSAYHYEIVMVHIIPVIVKTTEFVTINETFKFRLERETEVSTVENLVVSGATEILNDELQEEYSLRAARGEV